MTEHFIPGDARLEIDGEPMVLRLTLGALAEIEAAFGDLGEAMAARLKQPSARDLMTILHALLKGGGADIRFADLAASDIDVGEAARAIAAAFRGLENDPFAEQNPADATTAHKEAPGKSPRRGERPGASRPADRPQADRPPGDCHGAPGSRRP